MRVTAFYIQCFTCDATSGLEVYQHCRRCFYQTWQLSVLTRLSWRCSNVQYELMWFHCSEIIAIATHCCRFSRISIVDTQYLMFSELKHKHFFFELSKFSRLRSVATTATRQTFVKNSALLRFHCRPTVDEWEIGLCLFLPGCPGVAAGTGCCHRYYRLRTENLISVVQAWKTFSRYLGSSCQSCVCYR